MSFLEGWDWSWRPSPHLNFLIPSNRKLFSTPQSRLVSSSLSPWAQTGIVVSLPTCLFRPLRRKKGLYLLFTSHVQPSLAQGWVCGRHPLKACQIACNYVLLSRRKYLMSSYQWSGLFQDLADYPERLKIEGAPAICIPWAELIFLDAGPWGQK